LAASRGSGPDNVSGRSAELGCGRPAAAFSEIDEFSKQVVTASTGLQALAILRDNSRISILLTDIQMPGMGGEELAGIAATSRPDLRVIFASGSIRPSADAAFLQKP
jgi:two-component system cell cycle response regulator CpdR